MRRCHDWVAGWAHAWWGAYLRVAQVLGRSLVAWLLGRSLVPWLLVRLRVGGLW